MLSGMLRASISSILKDDVVDSFKRLIPVDNYAVKTVISKLEEIHDRMTVEVNFKFFPIATITPNRAMLKLLLKAIALSYHSSIDESCLTLVSCHQI